VPEPFVSSDPSHPPAVGIVIRTLDEGAWIERCLNSLRAQRGPFELDIVVVDSGSTDSTVALSRAGGARVVELPPAEFDYSKALNTGVEHVSGDLIVSLSAHAIPTGDEWLKRLLAPFADERVAGVWGRQIPWDTAPWKEVQRLRERFGAESRLHPPAPPDELAFSNAASAFRRSVWSELPFVLPAVEDLDWAQRAVAAGWHVAYAPDAVVRHSHEEPARAQAQRLIDISRAHDVSDRPRRLTRTVREAGGLVARDGRAILQLPLPWRRRRALLTELVATAWYYVRDFSRSGSTAERRRVEPG
jgi:glycosyltransferase involved in cell wall biosynthesis